MVSPSTSPCDGLTAWLTYVAQNHFASGETPRRYGSAHPNIVPYQGFATGDGDIMVAVGDDALWGRFAHVVDLDDVVDDERFATNPGRVAHRDELLPLIERALAARTASEWTELLTQAGVPVGPILTVPETLIHPQVLSREMVVDLPHRTQGTIRTLGSPLKLSATPPALRHASPTHGQDTATILAAMGLRDDEVARLREQGAIGG